MPGSKHIYLGLYSEESAAARAYDRALVRLRGPGAATNYTLANYKSELQAFEMDSSTEKLTASITSAAKALQDKEKSDPFVKVESDQARAEKAGAYREEYVFPNITNIIKAIRSTV